MLSLLRSGKQNVACKYGVVLKAFLVTLGLFIGESFHFRVLDVREGFKTIMTLNLTL